MNGRFSLEAVTAPVVFQEPGAIHQFFQRFGDHGRVIAAGWFIAVLGIHVAGRVIADKGSYTRTLRGLGFANVVTLIRIIGLLPALAPLAAPIGIWLPIIAIWLGAAAAHNARGWRSIILPFLGVFFAVLVPVLAMMMVSGAVFSLESVLTQLGFVR